MDAQLTLLPWYQKAFLLVEYCKFPQDGTPNTALYSVFSALEIKFIVQINKYMWYCVSVVSNKYS